MTFTRTLLAAALVAVHGAALLSPWLAPYDPTEQHRDASYVPPTRVHLVNPDGLWERPFVCASTTVATPRIGVAEDCRARYPVRWFVATTEPPRPARPATSTRWRLFAVEPPGQLFLLGTDIYGRDQLSRLLVGARMSLLAALLGTSLAVGLGMLTGMMAGYLGGTTETALTGLSNLLQAVPVLYLLLAARAAFPLTLGPADVFLSVTALLGLVGWARPYRLIRA